MFRNRPCEDCGEYHALSIAVCPSYREDYADYYYQSETDDERD